MDMQKIGAFLAHLRKESGMTQEQLGEKLGISNKTISRWETGNYLPPVEMLQLLSDLYGITINEILAAERLTQEQFQVKAEENVKMALKNSAFTLREKVDFFEKKWQRDHLFTNLASFAFFTVLTVGLGLYNNGLSLLALLLGIVLLILRNQQKMVYIEQHAFDGLGPGETVSKERGAKINVVLFQAGLLLLCLALMLNGLELVSDAGYFIMVAIAVGLEIMSMVFKREENS